MVTDGGSPDVPLEFVARIRGREVTCRWRDGRLDGDAELLRRIRRLDPIGVCKDAASVARLVRDAVGSDVVIRAAVA